MPPKKVLFACIKNAGRSQMANAFFNALAHPEDAVSISAGTDPADHVHPCVAEAMLELGMDLSMASPTKLTAELASTCEMLITMGCGEKCPYVPGLRVIDWRIEDPKDKPVEEVRVIRDGLKQRIQQFITEQGWRLREAQPAAPMVFKSCCSGGGGCGPAATKRVRCNQHQFNTAPVPTVPTCVGKQVCVPAVYDQEDNCVYCELPGDADEGKMDCHVFEDAGKFFCHVACEEFKALEKERLCQFNDSNMKDATPDGAEVLKQLSWVDKLLPIWIIGAMVVGVLLGYYIPEVRHKLETAHFAEVSLPIAIGLWMMMVPVLTKVRYELLNVMMVQKAMGKQFMISFVLNWIIGPFLMCGLAWLCLPDLPTFRNGVIMVGLARCIAMVLIWNQLASGNAELCAVLVAFNSILQIVLYAPLTVFFLQTISGSAGIGFSFWPVCRSVLVFLGIPLVAGVLIRYSLLAFAGAKFFHEKFMPWFGPLALLSLIYTIIVMFAVQGDRIIDMIGEVARVSVPMALYFCLMFFGSLFISWKAETNYSYAVTQAFTASSNNFELAIAVAVATFGIESHEALAATIGPLIEVPALLGLVYVALWIKKHWYDRRDAYLKSIGKFPTDLHQFVAPK